MTGALGAWYTPKVLARRLDLEWREGARHAALAALPRIEFDSIINGRPAQGNRSHDVEDAAIQSEIRQSRRPWQFWVLPGFPGRGTHRSKVGDEMPVTEAPFSGKTR
jgi:hypothetical protein